MIRRQVIFAYKFYPRETFEMRLAAYLKNMKPRTRKKAWEGILKEIMKWEENLVNIQRRRLFYIHGVNQKYTQTKKSKS